MSYRPFFVRLFVSFSADCRLCTSQSSLEPQPIISCVAGNHCLSCSQSLPHMETAIPSTIESHCVGWIRIWLFCPFAELCIRAVGAVGAVGCWVERDVGIEDFVDE